jgi:hypothetical protein
MILKFYENNGHLTFPLPTYDDFISLFPRTRLLGYPPGQLSEYLKNDERFNIIEIEHKKASSLLDVEYFIRRNMPIILIFDHVYYHSQSPTMAMHASVMVGYTPENIIVNDAYHGLTYSFERNRFNLAWQLKHRRYVLIKPPRVRLDRWMSE